MTTTLSDEATKRPWQQINATVYQLRPDASGELVNRFSFTVDSNNRSLGPGEAEQIASEIVRAVNSYDAQAEVITNLLTAARAVIKDNGLNSDNAAGLRDAIEAAERLEK